MKTCLSPGNLPLCQENRRTVGHHDSQCRTAMRTGEYGEVLFQFEFSPAPGATDPNEKAALILYCRHLA